MLIQSLTPGTIESAISFVSRIGTQDSLCNQLPGLETWLDYAHREQHPHNKLTKFLSSSDGSCFLDIPSAHLQISSCTTMTGSSVPMFVYKRKKQKITSNAIFPVQIFLSTTPGDRCCSSINSHVPSESSKENTLSVEAEIKLTESPGNLNVKCDRDGIISKSAYSNGCLVGSEGRCSEEDLRSDSRKTLDACRIDDSCSSSKLNLGVATTSLQTDGDDTRECSSSVVSISERVWDNMSPKDFCIFILRRQGLLQRASPHDGRILADSVCANCCSRVCKVRNSSVTTVNMLICDNCEDAFHLSCCYPRLKKIPVDEWFCYSCLKKKRKLFMEKSTSNSLNIDTDIGQCGNATSEGELGPIESMLKDMEPCKFPVRIGCDFQAEIPDQPQPFIDEVDHMREPEEMIRPEHLYLHNSSKTPNLSSIGNWVQCQQVIEDIGEDDGTICGKWRRAPLFEVQTDGWECFRAVLWDPAHADCAVPQELPTDEVLRQLKYIEKLRPCLAAKKRKLDRRKSSSSQVPKRE